MRVRRVWGRWDWGRGGVRCGGVYGGRMGRWGGEDGERGGGSVGRRGEGVLEAW